jgi:hypothetical protein
MAGAKPCPGSLALPDGRAVRMIDENSHAIFLNVRGNSCAKSTIRFKPDAQQRRIVRDADGRKLLKEWLLRLDSNQQPSG